MSTEPIPPKGSLSAEFETPVQEKKLKYGSRIQKQGPTPSAPVRRISSSTSTFMTDGDVGMKKPVTLIPSICLLLRQHIESGKINPTPILVNIFSEELHPLNLPTDPKPRPFDVPTVEEIIFFVNLIVSTLELHPCTYLMSLCYIERIIKSGGLTLHPTNWRRVCFSSLLLAGKVFHDEAPWNADMSDSFPWITLADVNTTELKLLELLKFSVTFTPQQYAQYYLMCREISQRTHQSLPSEVLSAEELSRLESKTNAGEIRIKENKRISRSDALFDRKKTNPAVLS
ncbi:putative cyclin domain-containing protein [Monocercomonoides exilis]|uniref:putative cyclin domain-containing protein n=1 Tax=Monocercomonoides exilis TaxID=2049356 RepID=UPI003559ABA2|nr:putative cyclin domain-containing protein [Monocercomonoides exilis]|eukprot:MONOS_13278.1-p1 / transcript=MONOS_13278.1 / gene=MONOS_13278 / organism=Monocercomonoides_exilis_PA203 / gene_product=cyclin domain-containing protein / transcript_product=cyclin domain-containing protein / location=Mono_scaffold00803:211-1333(-) / protein_length=285 / sequence_SO=supercontig / SO=protein_coding / is_pseudo=false